MYLSRVTPATSLPVTLTEALMQCRIDDASSPDVTLVQGFLSAAVQMVGESAGRVMATETWAMSIPTPSGDVALPKSPVQAITSIEYYDAADALQAATVGDFYLFKDDDRAALRPKPGKSWPSASSRDDAVRITFTCGYTAIPAGLRTAILLTVGHLYENREAVITGRTGQELPFGVEAFVEQHRLKWVAA